MSIFRSGRRVPDSTARVVVTFKFLALFLLASLYSITLPQAQAQSPTLVSSVFKGGTDGWKGVVDGDLQVQIAKLRGQVAPPKPARKGERNVRPSRDATSPGGGHITLAALGGDGRTLYFEAPNKYKGDRRAAYGGALVVQIRQAATRKFSNAPFVVLASKQTILFYDLGRNPGTVWERIEVPLKEGAGWINPAKGDRVPATKADLESALGALSELWIKAEYSFDEDRADLAEVQLNKPAP